MFKAKLGLGLVLVGVLLIFAACAAPGSTSQVTESPNEMQSMDNTAGQVPETGSTGANGECVNVDTAQLLSRGETLYTDQCASCHGTEGEGVDNFPGLAGDTKMNTASAAELVEGYFSVEAHPMSVSIDNLSALLTYVRGSFGNTGAAVCADQVQQAVPTQQ